MLFSLSVLLLLGQLALALTPAEWRSQSIYFLLTDRFGRDDNSTTATCNTGDRVTRHTFRRLFGSTTNYSQIYCGGTWQGIINHVSNTLGSHLRFSSDAPDV